MLNCELQKFFHSDLEYIISWHFFCLQTYKTGCLITTDGSEDNKIHPEGLPDHKVPPPILLEPSTALQNCHQSQNMTVKWKRMFLMILRVKIGNIEVAEDGELSSDGWIFHLFNLWLSVSYNVHSAVLYWFYLFPNFKTFFTLGNINFSSQLFWDGKNIQSVGS